MTDTGDLKVDGTVSATALEYDDNGTTKNVATELATLRSMIGGSGKTVTAYTTYSDFYAAYTAGQIPIGADVFIYTKGNYSTHCAHAICSGPLRWACEGAITGGAAYDYYSVLQVAKIREGGIDFALEPYYITKVASSSDTEEISAEKIGEIRIISRD